ncbi:relaxase/mobilization nuclease domain-containing protein [Corynebacterium pseudodiphtheriticum]|uniref:relaxase/mobilization nuclease domain-containing protein n=1 Tax=Corynebacterium pseudodiphtheriticum TaxID=37637 RepID=UPI0020BDC6B1|nr:relaxase/mobilization nuclease domain-containing protein [Corynebacterium pseudodiphtheriticum]UQV53644.1 relaxase/mobilization nuclease domain-containing protein [Corynebacterium pseudodiphtheriticum]
MSVTKVQRTKSVGAATVYAVYGTYEGMRNGEVRAAAYSVVSATPDATPKQFISETVAEIARHPQRKNQAELIIQSFHPDELDKDSSFDIHLAQLAGQELAHRIAPNSDVVVATHTDSESGHLHNHIIFANHDRVTGKTPRNVRNFHKVKHFNDEVMRDLKLEVYELEAAPAPQRDYSHLRGAPLPEITKENWRAEMQQRVDAVLADSRVAAAPSVDEGLEVAQDIAAEYSVSFRVVTHEKKRRDDVAATTYALVAPGGEPVRYATARGSRSTERTGSRLGKEDYTLDAVKRRIAERQQQYQQQQQQQQLQQQHIKKFQEDDYAQAAQATTATATPADHTVGAAGIDGASIRERYLDGAYIPDTPAPAATPDATATPAATAASSALPSVHPGGDGRVSVDEPYRAGDGATREAGRGVGGSLREPQPSASAGRGTASSDGEQQPEVAASVDGRDGGAWEGRVQASGSAETRSPGSHIGRVGAPVPYSWSPDGSMKDMPQVYYDFFTERVMDDEFRQFQRSEFDGSDAQFFEHLRSDDDVVAFDFDAYVKPRTRLFNPVGGRSGRERALRTVEENKRRLDTARRDMARRRQQGKQRSQPGPQFGL